MSNEAELKPLVDAAPEEVSPEPVRALNEAAPLIGALVADALAKMKRRRDGDEKPVPLPWDHVADAYGGGLWPGLHVLVGQTGTGKTQYGLQVALHAAQAGTPVLYVALELGRLDIVARLTALLDEMPGQRLQWSELYLGQNPNKHDAWERSLHLASTRLGELPIRVEFGDEGPYGWDYSQLYSRVKAMKAENPSTPLVVLDFLQIVGNPEGAERDDTRIRIQKASYAARQVARALDAAVLVVSSMSRENAKNAPAHRRADDTWDYEQLIGTGKEAGEIEYSADTLTVLVRDSEKRGGIYLVVPKVRAGRPSALKLTFNGTRFAHPDVAHPDGADLPDEKRW